MATNNDPLFVDPVLLQQAEQLCKERLKNDPESRAVLRSLAEVYRKLGNLAEAAAIYDRLVHLDPQDQNAGYIHALLGGQEWPTAPTGTRAAPFVLLKDFLPREFHASLIPFLISVREKFVPALITGEKGGGRYDPSYRDTLDFTDKWESKKRFRGFCEKVVPGAIPQLHLAPFQVEFVELHVRAYEDGHFFKVHQDTNPDHPMLANRAISFVYFFHRMPRAYAGGELLLFDTDSEANKFTRSRFTAVVPEDNAIILFPSNFYHSVVPVRCPSKDFGDSRFVINGFVRKRVPKPDTPSAQSTAASAAVARDG